MEGFAATAAHQLSEPLIVAESGTIMVAEDLGDALDPELRARLDAIGRGAARARQMVDALLLDARSGSGLELKPVDTGADRRAGARRPGAADGASAAPSPRSATLPVVHAEPRLLSVVFHNLISNAIKYGPREGGRIEIEADAPTATAGGSPSSAAARRCSIRRPRASSSRGGASRASAASPARASAWRSASG